MLYRVFAFKEQDWNNEPGFSYFFTEFDSAMKAAIQLFPSTIEAYDDTDKVLFASYGQFARQIEAPLMCDTLLLGELHRYYFGFQHIADNLVICGTAAELACLPPSSISTHEISYEYTWLWEVPPTNLTYPIQAALAPLELFSLEDYAEGIPAYPCISRATIRGVSLINPGNSKGFGDRPNSYKLYFDRFASFLMVAVAAKQYDRVALYVAHWQKLGDQVLQAFCQAINYKIDTTMVV